MTSRPPMPPEVREAYDRGERVRWSTVRACWVVDGPPRTQLAPKDMRGGRSAVRAALEELAPRAPKPRPLPPTVARCPRCGGSVVRATDEDGSPDDHCIACGARANALTPDQAEAFRREVDEREQIEGRGRRRRPHSSNGVAL